MIAQELYPIHPHRMFTVGKAVASGQDISVAVRTVNQSDWAHTGNVGWNYGLNAAALIGLTDQAASQACGRGGIGGSAVRCGMLSPPPM